MDEDSDEDEDVHHRVVEEGEEAAGGVQIRRVAELVQAQSKRKIIGKHLS